MVELKNEQLSVVISEKGAELQSIKDANGKEYLWQGDSKYWGRRSPILFPIVCSVNDETYRIDGQEYHLPRHGFARDAEFVLISPPKFLAEPSGKAGRGGVSEGRGGLNKCTFALESSEDTKKVYPYDFTLSVSYVLDNNKIGVIWHVHNTDTQEIHFQIGGHPAFNIPGMKAGENQYGRIRLDNEEPMDALHSYGDGSHEMDEVPFVEAEGGLMEFTDNTWRNDSIKIHKCQLHRAELLGAGGDPEVTVTFRTPVIAFWSPFGKQAPFVCIEPWYGIGDPRGFKGEFKDKPMMNHLQPGASFMSRYDIIIG